MLSGELATQVDAVWGAFSQEVEADPQRAISRITRLVGGDGEIRGAAPPARQTATSGQAAATPELSRTVHAQLHEYLLSKVEPTGESGAAYSTISATPHSVTTLMVALVAPTPRDTIIDPAVGTGGLLVAAGEFLREHHPEVWLDPRLREHFSTAAFTGVDSTASACGVALMNLQFHGSANPTILHADSLAEGQAGVGRYSLVLAHPPSSGMRTAQPAARALLKMVRTKRVELLYLAQVLRLLEVGGRAAVIVPDSLLAGTSKAHLDLRRMLLTEFRLDAVVRLPPAVLRAEADRSSSILLVQKSGMTADVWFYDVRSQAVRPPTGGPEGDPADPGSLRAADLVDLLSRWKSLETAPSSERARPRGAQSFVVGITEITDQDFDLSFDRYRIAVAEFVAHRSPTDILVDITRLELRIQQGAAALARSLADGSVGTP
ncbi:MAG: N-6 DNA methylase [Actinomycetota bacterium]